MSDTAAPSRPAVGDPAPDFTLPDDTGAERSLSAERGHWLVLYFYPKDDTPGCTTESCQFRDAYEEYQRTGAEVWGISVLGSGSKAAFKAKFGLPFTLIADEDHAVAEAYGAWGEKSMYGKKYQGIIRSAFLVDEKGKIEQAWPKISPKDTPANLKKALGV